MTAGTGPTTPSSGCSACSSKFGASSGHGLGGLASTCTSQAPNAQHINQNIAVAEEVPALIPIQPNNEPAVE